MGLHACMLKITPYYSHCSFLQNQFQRLSTALCFPFLFSAPAQREDTPTPQPSDKQPSVHQTPVEANEFPQLPEGLEKKPIVLKFSAMLDGITIGAALLPSLKAEYKMGRMKSHGMTGLYLETRGGGSLSLVQFSQT